MSLVHFPVTLEPYMAHLAFMVFCFALWIAALIKEDRRCREATKRSEKD